MVSWFNDESKSLRNIIDEWGEEFLLTPFRIAKVNFPSGPDATRRPVRFMGAFDRQGKNIGLGMEEVHVASRDPCVTALKCDIPYAVQQADRLTHIDTGEVFEVSEPVPDGMSGIELRLVQIGRSGQ